MAVTAISRDTLTQTVSIVRMVTTSTVAQAGTTGYLLAQADIIAALNNGAFEWLATDYFVVAASDGWLLGNISSDFESIIPTVFSTTVVGAPVVVGNFAVFASTGGNIKDSGFLPSDASKTSVVMAGSATVIGRIAHFIDTAGTIDDTAGVVSNLGGIYAGASGTAGVLRSYPAGATSGYLGLTGVANAGDYGIQISNASFGQASVISIPDPGTSTSKFVLQDGNNTVLSVLNLKYGATPVAQVDPASCTITAAAGASNTATVTVQLKDGSGTNMARIIPFRVYASSAADGLTLASAASTGFSVASGGLSINNGAAITTQISAMSSATGGCVLSLLDSAKQTSYLVLVLANGTKISAQLSSGSYGA